MGYDNKYISELLVTSGKEITLNILLKESFTKLGEVVIKAEIKKEDAINKMAFTPKKRFLVKTGDNYNTINSSDIAFLASEEGITFATLFNKQKYIVDYSIVELSKEMETADFFQINRKMIINISSVKKINSWFNSRIKLELTPSTEEDIIVSRERVSSFKQWLDK